MKYRFLLLSLLFFGLSVVAQAQAYLFVKDSTHLVNQDTQIVNLLTLSQGRGQFWGYSVSVRADSISGANAGTIYLQQTNDGNYWTTVGSTVTIDGNAASYDELTWEGTLYARRLRVYTITPAGTRNVKVVVRATLKKSTGP